MKYAHLALFTILLVFMATLNARAQLAFGPPGPKLEWETVVEKALVRPGTMMRGAVRIAMGEEWHVNSHTPLEEFLIPTTLSMKDAPGVALARIAYPEHTQYTFSFSKDPLAVYENVFHIGFELQLDEAIAPGDHELSFTLKYQACNDKICTPPKELSFPVLVTVTQADEQQLASSLPPWFIEVNWLAMKATTQESPSPTPSPSPETPATTTEPEPIKGDWRALADQFETSGTLAGFANTSDFLAFIQNSKKGAANSQPQTAASWWWMLLIVLGGGLMLNLTPCVLPLIPINIAIIGAGAQAGSRVRGFALGGAYGLGIAAVYGALGLVVVLGMSAAFGTLNSTAWFNAAIAVFFVILALAMLDIIQIDFSRYQAKLGVGGGNSGRILAALGMGAVSALLAGACVAPVVIYTILQAQDLYSQGHVMALALPFGLGLGMALPWPFLGAGLSLLPKPGKWMTRVKQGFAVFILGFALYYGHLAYTLYAPQTAVESHEGPWTTSLEAGLAQALEEKRPVIIDFWATWCKNCSVMDRTVLRDDEVLSELEGHVKIKYQAESLSTSPTSEVVDYFKVLGLPTFIILEPKG